MSITEKCEGSGKKVAGSRYHFRKKIGRDYKGFVECPSCGRHFHDDVLVYDGVTFGRFPDHQVLQGGTS